jgi:hypothetical protein
MLAIGALLAGYFVFVYRPLSRNAAELRVSLLQTQRRFPSAATPGAPPQQPDLERISQELDLIRAAGERLDTEKEEILARCALDPAVRTKMREPFQLISFQNERQVLIEDLTKLAQTSSVKLDPSVLPSFPEYTADQRQPSLLWAQMEFLRHILILAIRTGVTLIEHVELPPVQVHILPGAPPASLDQVNIRIQVIGSMRSVSQFLMALPLRAEEMSPFYLPEMPARKPAMFIDRLLIRKHSLQMPDEVQLDLRTCGFVLRE